MRKHYLIEFVDRAEVVFRAMLMTFLLVVCTPFLAADTLFFEDYVEGLRPIVFARRIFTAYRALARCCINSLYARDIDEFKRMNSESNQGESFDISDQETD